jgi:hypothetical protein
MVANITPLSYSVTIVEYSYAIFTRLQFYLSDDATLTISHRY